MKIEFRNNLSSPWLPGMTDSKIFSHHSGPEEAIIWKNKLIKTRGRFLKTRGRFLKDKGTVPLSCINFPSLYVMIWLKALTTEAEDRGRRQGEKTGGWFLCLASIPPLFVIIWLKAFATVARF